MTQKRIEPQEGFQYDFTVTKADIAFGGGAAGAGKSFGLLLDFGKYVRIENFGGVIFRRSFPQITGEGGLWDTSETLFTSLHRSIRPKPNIAKHSWQFPSGNKLSFAHMQHEKDKYNWQGTQIPYLAFDELTQFSENQFWYLVSRNRSVSGYKPIIRATMNPQGSGWVKDMISWYLYPEDYPVEALADFPRPDRAGKLRYFLRYGGQLIWGNSRREVLTKIPSVDRGEYGPELVKSFTFIPGTLDDNAILNKADPGYRGNLMSLPQDEQAQLLKGRWRVQADDRIKLFASKAIRDAYTSDYIAGGKKYLTADIAMEGADKFVIYIWEGWRLTHVYRYDYSLGNTVLNLIKKHAADHGVPHSRIAYDAQGVGNFLKGFLKTAVGVLHSAKPIEINGQKQNYLNLRAQLYYTAAAKVNEFEAYIGIDRKSAAGNDLYRELDAINKRETTNGKLAIEPKSAIAARIGGSPDNADAYVMRAIFDLMAKPKRSRSSGAG